MKNTFVVKKIKVLAVVLKIHKLQQHLKDKKTDPAINLVTGANMSTRKAGTVCKILARTGVCLSTSSQSGVYKASIKAGGKIKEYFMKTLKNKNWNLHFDGKHIRKTEYQVVILKFLHHFIACYKDCKETGTFTPRISTISQRSVIM